MKPEKALRPWAAVFLGCFTQGRTKTRCQAAALREQMLPLGEKTARRRRRRRRRKVIPAEEGALRDGNSLSRRRRRLFSRSFFSCCESKVLGQVGEEFGERRAVLSSPAGSQQQTLTGRRTAGRLVKIKCSLFRSLSLHSLRTRRAHVVPHWPDVVLHPSSSVSSCYLDQYRRQRGSLTKPQYPTSTLSDFTKHRQCVGESS